MKVTNRTRTWSKAAMLLATVAASYSPSLAWSASDIEFPPIVRVRSSNLSIAAVIDEAAQGSTVFRRLLAA